MKKFTYLMESLTIGQFPDCVEDIVELFENEKEYGHGCENVAIAKGYTTKYNLTQNGKAQSVQITSARNLKTTFPGGVAGDKWLVCVKATFKYKPIVSSINVPNLRDWDTNVLWSRTELAQILDRIKSVNTLCLRLEKWCHVVVSPIGSNGFAGGDTGDSICVLAVVKS